MIRFGVTLRPDERADRWRDKMRRFEDDGFDVLLVNDHLTGPRFAPLVALGVAAALTERARLGMLVLANDYRNPVVLAKEIATLDVLSQGRVEVGLGTGWLRADYDAAGLGLDPPGERIDRLVESLGVLRAAWSGEPLAVSGRHYRAAGPPPAPRPAQRPHPPVMLGGGGPRMLALAAREADIVNISNRTAADGRGVAGDDVGLPGLRRKLALVAAAAAGRARPPELSVSVRAVAVDGPAGTVHPALAAHVDALRGTPFLLAGSAASVAEDVLAWHAEHGISYFVLGEEADAPAMARVMEHVRAGVR